MVYLTLYGNAPTEYSAKELTKANDGYKEVMQISFQNDISNWIEKCLSLSETLRLTPIREILLQFSSAIKSITNQMEDKPMNEMIKLLSTPANMRNADVLTEALIECKADMAIRLFKAIEAGLGKARNVGYESGVRDYYVKNKLTWPGLIFHIEKVRGDVEILFVVEIGDGDLYAGFVTAKDGGNQGWQLTPKESDRYNLSQDQETRNWWSTNWVYLPGESQSWNDNEHPNFRVHNDKYYELFDEVKLNDFVDKSVKQIRKMWDQWAKEASKK